MRYFYMEDGVLTEYLGVIKSNAEMAGYAKYEGTKSVDWLKLDEEGIITEMTPEEYEVAHRTLKSYESAVDELLKNTANERGYDSAYTCLSYMNSINPTWKAEAEAFNSWRDSVWLKCHEILNAVNAGTRPAPSIEELLSELPQIDWGKNNE